jgi:hypothetical protein
MSFGNDHSLNDPPFQQSRAPRIVFALVIAAIIISIALCQEWKRHADAKEAAVNAPGEVVVWLLNNEKTFGFDDISDLAWNRTVANELEKQIDRIRVTVQDSSLPSLNSSEGLDIARGYLDVAKTQEGKGVKGNFRKPMPDFALINFGIDNLWNLHSATVITSGKYGSDDPSVKKIMEMTDVTSAMKLPEIARRHYFDFYNLQGWNVFFEDFNVQLLQDWLRADVLEMVEVMRGSGIEPVIVTFCFDDFPGANAVLREAAAKSGALLIDVEKPQSFYDQKGFSRASVKDDLLYLNGRGQRFVGESIVEQLTARYNQAFFDELVEKKKAATTANPER